MASVPWPFCRSCFHWPLYLPLPDGTSGKGSAAKGLAELALNPKPSVCKGQVTSRPIHNFCAHLLLHVWGAACLHAFP